MSLIMVPRYQCMTKDLSEDLLLWETRLSLDMSETLVRTESKQEIEQTLAALLQNWCFLEVEGAWRVRATVPGWLRKLMAKLGYYITLGDGVYSSVHGAVGHRVSTLSCCSLSCSCPHQRPRMTNEVLFVSETTLSASIQETGLFITSSGRRKQTVGGERVSSASGWCSIYLSLLLFLRWLWF